MPELPAFDVVKFADALEAARWRRRISWRQVAREAGVTPNITTRLTRHRRPPDVDGLVRLLAWLGTYDLGGYVSVPSGGDPLLALTPGEYRDAGPEPQAAALNEERAS